jgi:hypothetical protein
VATFSKDEHGVWTMTLDETDAQDRNAVFDEAVPRYLNAFDPAFVRAAEADEAEFVKALLRISSVQEAGWDPYETTLRAVPAMQKLHALIPEGDEWYETSRHLALWTYGHVVEASEPYAMLADLLDIAGGGSSLGVRFPDVPLRPARAGELRPPTRPQRHDEKMTELRRLADAAGLQDVLIPLDEVWDRKLRNAVFHADYSIHGSETRIPAEGTRYAHDELQNLVNKALAYHEALAVLRRIYRLGYREPVTIPIFWRRPVEGGGDGEVTLEEDVAVVMIRDGVGAIGLKHAHTADEIAHGAIPWHIAHLFTDEAAALRADPTLAHFPSRN